MITPKRVEECPSFTPTPVTRLAVAMRAACPSLTIKDAVAMARKELAESILPNPQTMSLGTWRDDA